MVVPLPDRLVIDEPDVAPEISNVPLFTTPLLLAIDPLPDSATVEPEEIDVAPAKVFVFVKDKTPPPETTTLPGLLLSLITEEMLVVDPEAISNIDSLDTRIGLLIVALDVTCNLAGIASAPTKFKPPVPNALPEEIDKVDPAFTIW